MQFENISMKNSRYLLMAWLTSNYKMVLCTSEVLYLRNYRHSGQSVSLCVVTRNLWVKQRECCHHVADFEEIQPKFREEDFQLCN